LGQPSCRVNGQDNHLATRFRGPQRNRGGGRGFADSARSAADDDLGIPVADDLVDVEEGHCKSSLW
jgi:hypothetical protein